MLNRSLFDIDIISMKHFSLGRGFAVLSVPQDQHLTKSKIELKSLTCERYFFL